MITIGIDPGNTGAVCVLEDATILKHTICPVIKTGRKKVPDPLSMCLLLQEYEHQDVHAFIEQVSARPGQGVVSMFNFGKNYGVWIGICMAFRFSLYLPRPQDWKQEMLRGTSKDKGAAILKARQIEPNIVLQPGMCRTDQHGLAEAFLIAKYGQRYLLKNAN